MILVDRALRERAESGNPIRLALVGAGYSGRNIAHQILISFPGIRLVAISIRHVDAARQHTDVPVCGGVGPDGEPPAPVIGHHEVRGDPGAGAV